MSELHNYQIMVQKNVQASQNIQGISNAQDSSRMISLFNKVKQFQESKKKVNENNKTENSKVNPDGKNKNNIMNFNSQKENKDIDKKNNFKFDEYRGNTIDVRL
ncbi:hypothetical protein [Geotoga petraea]|uniref:Uncharacterized protein n=1 Tax=Geotoga petraea TaxID=28234 RepID=A0A1G6K1N9_9BACT|nr:hypothetical protein [Geotoga petraea]MDK2946543.1 hypothetical protein [Geotoga sp.]TGG88395.1 hypothetical protein E4650_04955 [Geotoga petraea]SDC24949.1 hypothetical protein SAMN04488588_0709 [Geotoga petraea]